MKYFIRKSVVALMKEDAELFNSIAGHVELFFIPEERITSPFVSIGDDELVEVEWKVVIG